MNVHNQYVSINASSVSHFVVWNCSKYSSWSNL